MSRPIVPITAFFLILSACADSRAQDAEPPKTSEVQILVLRNGQAIEGKVTRTDWGYVVDMGDGQIRVKAADADLVCQSLEDGYRLKRLAIRPGNVHHHLELAQWCLSHGLLGPAGVELADAKVAEPDNPLVAVFEHRLQMALEPPSATGNAGRRKAGPSNEELDRMVRSLPHGSVEAFTQSVQPVLMNNCATAACHGPNANNGLQLFRTSGNKLASRRITQRNLFSALQYIDRDDPANSPLLMVPSEPHGNAHHAIFNKHQAGQYGRVLQWASHLSQHSPPDLPETAQPASFDQPASAAAPPFDPEVFNRRLSPPPQPEMPTEK